MKVYHHTSLAHLPYIFAEGALIGSPANADWPGDYVWATSNPNGDRTVAACCQKEIPRVRIGFDAAEFEPWEAAIDANPEWEPAHKGTLLHYAANLGQLDTDCWFVAKGPVSLDRVLTVEIKTWSGPWRTAQPILEKVRYAGNAVEFVCFGKGYFVERARQPDRLGVERMHYGLKILDAA